MKKIAAYKCEKTGAIFEEESRAKESEFRAMMKSLGVSLPHMGSVNSTSIMEWLAGNIISEIYPSIADKLLKALTYYDENIRPPARPHPIPTPES
jgi:hypothetical protein